MGDPEPGHEELEVGLGLGLVAVGCIFDVECRS